MAFGRGLFSAVARAILCTTMYTVISTDKWVVLTRVLGLVIDLGLVKGFQCFSYLWPVCLYSVCFLFVLFLVYFLLTVLSCQYQCKWLPGKTRLRNHLVCRSGRETLLTHSLAPVRWRLPSLLTTFVSDAPAAVNRFACCVDDVALWQRWWVPVGCIWIPRRQKSYSCGPSMKWTGYVPVLSTSVKVANNADDLGVFIDWSLTMTDHNRAVWLVAYFQLRAIRLITRWLTVDTTESLVQAFKMSCRLDYCKTLELLWSNCQHSLRDRFDRHCSHLRYSIIDLLISLTAPYDDKGRKTGIEAYCSCHLEHTSTT